MAIQILLNIETVLILGRITVRKKTFNDLKDLEREPLRYCKCDGKVTFTRPFLMLVKVTFGEPVNVLERYCKGDLSITFTNLNGSLSKIKGP